MRLVVLLIEAAEAHCVLGHHRLVDALLGLAQPLSTLLVALIIMDRYGTVVKVALLRGELLQFLGLVRHHHRLIEFNIILNYGHLLCDPPCLLILRWHVLDLIAWSFAGDFQVWTNLLSQLLAGVVWRISSIIIELRDEHVTGL